MSTPYPDIEGQLYTTGAADAAYTEAEARQRAADRREVEATASAAGASALVDAKAYTDSKVSPLATVASVVAGDLQALADAKTYADSKVEDLGPGGGTYLDKAGNEKPYVFVVSDTDPGKTRTVNGKSVEVWWVQTTPPDPMQSTPLGVTQSVAGRSYTVPDDPVATYTVGGVLRSPGTYSIGTSAATTLTWTATAKSGYGFKAGAVTTGTLTWPVKTYASGDVLISDSFNRADGPLVGSTTDSFAGGEPSVWAPPGSSWQNLWGISDKKATKTGTSGANAARAVLNLPSGISGVVLEMVVKDSTSTRVPQVEITTSDGSITLMNNGGLGVNTNLTQGGAMTALLGLTINAGDVVRLTYKDGTGKWENVTTGEVAGAVDGDSTRWRIAGAPSSIHFIAANDYVTVLDNVKVSLP